MGMSQSRGIRQVLATDQRQNWPGEANGIADQIMTKMPQSGTTTLTPGSLNTNVSTRVNFPVAWPAGTTVAVSATPGIPSPQASQVSVTGVDNAGFTLNCMRSASAGTAVPIYWTAQPVGA